MLVSFAAIMLNEGVFLEGLAPGSGIVVGYSQDLAEQLRVKPVKHCCGIQGRAERSSLFIRPAQHQKLGGQSGLSAGIALRRLKSLQEVLDRIHW